MLLAAVLALVSTQVYAGQQWASSTTNYEYKAELGTMDRIWLYWDIDQTAKTITMEVHAMCQGFWGIGFSPNGNMPHSDIVIGYIDSNGKPQISDRHGASAPGFPPADPQQDYTATAGVNNGTHILLQFTRKLDTCDPNDFIIGKDTMRVLWTINSHKPQNHDDIVKHLQINRGARSVYFMDMHEEAPPPTGPNIGVFDVRSTAARLPDNYHSLFWCHTIERPNTGKVHMIRYEPLIQPGHEPYVHHMVLFACNKKYNMSEWVGKEEACWDPTDDPKKFSAMGICTQQFLAAWAVGDNVHIYPDDVGYPLFEEDGPIYYMLQMHYDNSAYHKSATGDFWSNGLGPMSMEWGYTRGGDITDNSGLRIYYTTKLRKNEAALMTVGGRAIEIDQVIPPGMKSYTNYAICPAKCTNSLPAKGINVFSGFLHMHLIGRVMKVRLFRNGVEEKPLFDDNNWDFNYQQVRMLKVPRIIMPGDDIQVECGMNSVGKSTTTIGGESTRNEMCFAFMEYWPRPKEYMEFCLSWYDPMAAYIDFFGLQNIWQKNATILPRFFVETADGRNMTFKNWVNTVPWHSKIYSPNGMMLQDRWQQEIINIQQQGVCTFKEASPTKRSGHVLLDLEKDNKFRQIFDSIGIDISENSKPTMFYQQGLFNVTKPWVPPNNCLPSPSGSAPTSGPSPAPTSGPTPAPTSGPSPTPSSGTKIGVTTCVLVLLSSTLLL